MKRLVLSTAAIMLFGFLALGQDISGTYSDGADKFIFAKQGNYFSFVAKNKEVKYAEGFAYCSTDAKTIVFVFKRVDNAQIGLASFVLEGKKLTGKTINPDLTERWKGTYTKQ